MNSSKSMRVLEEAANEGVGERRRRSDAPDAGGEANTRVAGLSKRPTADRCAADLNLRRCCHPADRLLLRRRPRGPAGTMRSRPSPNAIGPSVTVLKSGSR